MVFDKHMISRYFFMINLLFKRLDLDPQVLMIFYDRFIVGFMLRTVLIVILGF